MNTRARSRASGGTPLKGARRVVVKVGSALLVDQQSGRLNRASLGLLLMSDRPGKHTPQ
jgi:hypothetical protein